MSTYKGEVGEYIVEEILSNFSPNQVRYIHNMVLPRGNGSVTQIDFLILTPANFIALEVKNWNCTVKVTDTEDTWDLEYSSGKRLQSNPRNQNKMHVRILHEYSEYTYINRVFFTNKANIIGNNSFIINSIGLINLLKDSTIRYTQEEIKAEYNKMLDLKYKYYDMWVTRRSNFSSVEVTNDSILNSLKKGLKSYESNKM